jgi:hypothetical protein
MRKRREREILAEAIARLRQEGLSNPLPNEVVDETARRLAACAGQPSIRNPQPTIHSLMGWRVKFAAAAAVFLLAGYVAGKLTSPNVDQLREALTPTVAAALEPALRQRLGEELKDHYQVALAGTYVRLKEELAQQYRDDLNRFAVQTLAASNATTNALLAELVQAIDTTQAQDFRRIALALSQIEAKQVQDRTQLAAGIQTLAYRTEETKKVLVRFLTDEVPQEAELPLPVPRKNPTERSEE